MKKKEKEKEAEGTVYTYEKVWAMFAETDRRLDRMIEETRLRMQEADRQMQEIRLQMQETDRQMQETDRRMQETDRQMQETDRRMQETDRQMQETDRRMQETDRQMQETDRKIGELCEKTGGIDANIGFHAEQFFQDILSKTLTFGGEKYNGMLSNAGHTNGRGVEFDIILVNGKSVALIEVKNRIHPKFVKKFAEEKIFAFREIFPIFKNHEAYLGIAGFSFSKAVIEQAKKYGVGIIRQVGESVEMETGHLRAY